MAIVVMILGESGTGKSASMRNLDTNTTAVVNVIGKPFPFRKKGFETVSTDKYPEITAFLRKTDKKTIVIDDSQYLMGNEYMRRAQEKGFDKFTEMGQNFWNLVNFCIQKLPADTIVYFLQHVERTDSGIIKAKTIGNLLDSKITLEGMFSIVLRTNVNDGDYTFRTQNNGQDTVKSPVGMFDSIEIPNDLALVDSRIRQYYELDPETKPEPTQPEQPKPKGKKKAKAEQPEMAADAPHFTLNAPDTGIVDDENPLPNLTDYGRIKSVMNKRGITDEELRSVVAEKGIYPYETLIGDYDPDFIDYLIDNIQKIQAVIVAKRDPLG